MQPSRSARRSLSSVVGLITTHGLVAQLLRAWNPTSLEWHLTSPTQVWSILIVNVILDKLVRVPEPSVMEVLTDSHHPHHQPHAAERDCVQLQRQPHQYRQHWHLRAAQRLQRSPAIHRAEREQPHTGDQPVRGYGGQLHGQLDSLAQQSRLVPVAR